MEKQYQHFVSKFLLKNFTDNSMGKYFIHKFENGKWEGCNISNTGGVDLLYGSKDCSLENLFSNLENINAAIIEKHNVLDKKDKAYMKIFIQLMANRSPAKNQKISKEYLRYKNTLEKEMPDKVERCINLEKNKKEENIMLMSLEEDMELREIVNGLPISFDDNDESKFFTDTTEAVLQILPKVGKCFDISIFDSDHELVIGETPTVSVNLNTNEIKTNGEEAGLIHENVIYWLPIAYNKVAFMYTTKNIIVQENRKLCKRDVDILNYYQTKKSSIYYSRTQNINIPELPCDFYWVKHFNYVFGYKNKLLDIN
jgi:hypothetical protein